MVYYKKLRIMYYLFDLLRGAMIQIIKINQTLKAGSGSQ